MKLESTSMLNVLRKLIMFSKVIDTCVVLMFIRPSSAFQCFGSSLIGVLTNTLLELRVIVLLDIVLY